MNTPFPLGQKLEVRFEGEERYFPVVVDAICTHHLEHRHTYSCTRKGILNFWFDSDEILTFDP